MAVLLGHRLQHGAEVAQHVGADDVAVVVHEQRRPRMESSPNTLKWLCQKSASTSLSWRLL